MFVHIFKITVLILNNPRATGRIHVTPLKQFIRTGMFAEKVAPSCGSNSPTKKKTAPAVCISASPASLRRAQHGKLEIHSI